MEVQGHARLMEDFATAIESEKPPLAVIKSIHRQDLKPLSNSKCETSFQIRPSKQEGGIVALVLPDMATCKDCLNDIHDPTNRRYRYPFTNCTNCGPRYSIIEKLPYDRPYTSMKHFPMCEACQEEYEDPLNRRFHAQPNACPKCGPQLAFWDTEGNELGTREEALYLAINTLKSGEILALKGLGGFQLLVDGCNEQAVSRLRARKGRMSKPFALMAPNLETIRKTIPLSQQEEDWLTSSRAPIVLIEKKGTTTTGIAPSVSGHTPTLGFMLPYSPLHTLLIEAFDGIVVATSGNLSEEPICIDEKEALARMGRIADGFLVHNRPIVRPVDDSVVRMVGEQLMMIRRARGFAPFPIDVANVTPNRVAVGAHLKNAIALAKDSSVFISQHIGDLETLATRDCFESTIADLSAMYEFQPTSFLCDLHPDYASSRYATQQGQCISIQHHYAHVLACMAEHELEGPVLGVAWDGTGLGSDGTIWGGELLIASRKDWKRAGHLLPFLLPGGDRAAKEPKRIAASLLHKAEMEQGHGLEHLFDGNEYQTLKTMLERDLNCIATTSAGRLFDGIASLLNLCHTNGHEGQAPQALELMASLSSESMKLDLGLIQDEDRIIGDWRPLVKQLCEDSCEKTDAWVRSAAAGFHHALAQHVRTAAEIIGFEKVCLTGGCFQNRFLSECCREELEKAGFSVFMHHQIPANDGGIAAGQLYYLGS